MQGSPANLDQGRSERESLSIYDLIPDEPAFLKEIGRTWADVYRRSFSSEAQLVLVDKVRAHIEQLIARSSTFAQQAQSDNVSASNVERASDSMGTHVRGKLNKISVVFGGVLLGAGLSSFVSILLSPPQASPTALIVTFTLCAAGSFLVGLDLKAT
jgi:hypothetical protein